MSLFSSKSSRGVVKPSPVKGESSKSIGKTYPTQIDGERIEDLWEWTRQKVDNLLRARDLMTQSLYSSDTTRNDYVSGYSAHVVRNLDYYRDLRQALLRDGARIGTGSMVTNHLFQNIRTKYAMLIDNPASWRYTSGKPASTKFVHNLNHIKNVEIGRQQYYIMRMEAIAQMIAFGTSLTGFKHTIAYNQPYGDDYFYCCDPLSFLIDYGSRHINSSDPFSASILIVVEFKKKGVIEREYGKVIDDAESLIEPRKFSLWHNVPSSIDGLELEDMTGKIEEVSIYMRDDTTTPIYEDVPVMLPVIDYTQNPPVAVDESPDIDPETGQPHTKRKATGKRMMKYPDYRKIVFSRRTILYDGVLPENHGMIPHALWKNADMGIAPFGVGDIDIGRDDQINISEIQNAINDTIKSMPPIMLLNKKAIANKNEPIERDIDGFKVINVERLANGETLDSIVAFKQPTAISQDQIIQLRDSIQNLHDTIGSQQESFGVSAAADSGIKNEGQDARVLRFHSPILRQETRNIQHYAIMWLSNLIQFGNQKRTFSIIDAKGRPALQELHSALPELREAAYFGIEIAPHSGVAGSDAYFKSLVELNGLLPNAIPMNLILRYSPHPELVEMAESQALEREKIVKLVEHLEQTGQLDQLLNMASAPSAPPGTPAGQ